MSGTTIPLDAAEAYLVVRARLTAELSAVTTEQAAGPVPCCPDWTVGDTVAHLVGVSADILAGRLQDVGTPAWTAAQVAAGRGRLIHDLLAEWAGSGPRVAELLAEVPKVMGQVAMDAVSHEYDLRDALGLPLPADAPGGDPVLPVAVDWVVSRFVRAAERAGHPPFGFRVGDRSWHYRQGEPQVIAEWPALEALRALTGRRSRQQIRELPWSGDPGPWLPAFDWAVFEPLG